jgi:membrane-associated phospholipid phosphatase
MNTETAKPPTIEPVKEAVQTEITPRPTRNYRAWVFQGYVVAALIGFGILFFLARTVLYFPFDLELVILFQQVADMPVIGLPFTGLMVAVSWIGYSPQPYIMTLVIVAVIVLVGLRWEGICALLAAAGSNAFATAAKIIVQRPRPTEDLVHIVQRVGEFSFPSGHVVFYVTFFGFLLFLALTLFKPVIWRTLAGIVFGGLIVLVGPSRVYLGAHWPSDVVGAYLLGSLCLVAVINIYRWGKPRFFTQQPVAPETTPVPEKPEAQRGKSG